MRLPWRYFWIEFSDCHELGCLDVLLIPWHGFCFLFAHLAWRFQCAWRRQCRRLRIQTVGGRHVDWQPAICPRCLWAGPTCWSVHTYGDDGSGEDVVPVDECPRCGLEI